MRDDVTGDGERTLEWNFVASPGVRMEIRGDSVVLRRAEEAAGLVLSMEGLAGHRLAIERSSFSPAYESRVETDALRIAWKGALPVRACIRFASRIDPAREAGHR